MEWLAGLSSQLWNHTDSEPFPSSDHLFCPLPDFPVAHCQQAGRERDAGDPSVQLQQGLLQQVTINDD